MITSIPKHTKILPFVIDIALQDKDIIKLASKFELFLLKAFMSPFYMPLFSPFFSQRVRSL